MAKAIFYGRLADAMGRERNISLPAHVATVGAFVGFLAEKFPDFRDVAARTTIRVAVNDEIAGDDAPIGDADEVAFMPPFSGG